MNRSRVKLGDHVLDLATGTGLLAFLISPLVGATGKVVGVDRAQRFLEVARRKAKELAVTNIEFELMGARNLTFPDESFDVAISSEYGYLWTKEVLMEVRRVLKQGGRLCYDEFLKAGEAGAFSESTLVDKVFAKYRSPNPPQWLAQLREAEQVVKELSPSPNYNDGNQVRAALEEAGYPEIKIDVGIRESVLASITRYLQILVFIDYEAEFSVLNAQEQEQFLREAAEVVAPFSSPSGLVLTEEVLHITAVK